MVNIGTYHLRGRDRMLRSTKSLSRYRILAKDGDIGKAEEFFFDDSTWTIRYLVVDTGHWLPGRKVLISPVALGRPDWDSQEIPVDLTREQVMNSPDIDTDMPVSRQNQIELHTYYGWPDYWTFGGYYNVAPPPPPFEEDLEETYLEENEDPHLRSTGEVLGYHIQAVDGEIGHAEDFIVEDRSWIIRYLQADTRNWLPGKKVLISPKWITDISWTEQLVYVDLSRDAVRHSPEYASEEPVNREYEIRLYDYYGRPKYWHRRVRK